MLQQCRNNTLEHILFTIVIAIRSVLAQNSDIITYLARTRGPHVASLFEGEMVLLPKEGASVDGLR